MATEAVWNPAEHVLAFINDLVEWAGRMGAVHLTEEESALLAAATSEFDTTQLPQLRRELQRADRDDFDAAGFSESQAVFKTSVARRTMENAERRSRGFFRWLKRSGKALQVALDAVMEVLGSISSLSKWIEAAKELLGIVGSGIKSAGAKGGPLRHIRRWFKGSRAKSVHTPEPR